MKCTNCGAELRDGIKFCTKCGVKIERDAFCGNCGAKLTAEDIFCGECGTPVGGALAVDASEAPSKPRRGRPPKAEKVPEKANAPQKKKAYPDVRGFYEQKRAISASDRAIVFVDGSTMYRVDKELNLYQLDDIGYDNIGYKIDIAQTDDGVLALSINYDAEYPLFLHTMTDDLRIVSTRTICKLPGYEETDFYQYRLTHDAVYLIHYVPIEDDNGHEIHSELSFTRIDLQTDEKIVWTPEKAHLNLEGGKLSGVGNRLLVDGNTIYFPAGILFADDDGDEREYSAWLSYNFDSDTCVLLWYASSYQEFGKPRFFDFQKGIMWTNPREMEMKRRGWEKKSSSNLRTSTLPLVPRKIVPNAPILATQQIWEAYPDRISSFNYFDGNKAYCAPSYYNFYALTASGLISEDWNRTGHGRTETAVLWQNKIIMDLLADYWYTAYPAQFEEPNWKECIDMRNKTIKTTDSE